MKYEFLQPKFTEGVLAKSLQGRSSEEFYHYGYKSSKNMIPILSGPVVKRPGTNYIGDAKHSTAVFIPFFKDKDNTYIIELGSTSPSSGGYLRVWSQNQLLTDNTAVSDPPTYEYTAVFPWTAAELSTLKTTQSGDVIFVCCPTKPPQKIFRTLSSATTSGVADDNSVWAIEEFVTKDGPYKEINIWDESDVLKRFTLKLTTEPVAGGLVEIGDVQFNTIDNTLVLANHGLQVGQKIRLAGTGKGWGNIRQNTSGLTSDNGYKQTMMDGSKSVDHADAEGTTYTGSQVFDLDVYVIATTSTTFSFSDTDGGTVREFELVFQEEPTTASNTKVTVKKFVYAASSTPRSFTLYNNGSTGTTETNAYFKDEDEGRLIRINPLLKGGSNIGGIKWAWGIITAVTEGSSVITVTLKSEMANTRGSYGTSEFRLGLSLIHI